MHFKPHGDTRISRDDRLLVFAPQATANVEEINRVMRELAGHVAPLQGRSWTALVQLARDDALMTPEAELALQAAAPGLLQSGLCALALSGPDPSSLWIVEAQFRRVFASTGLPLSLHKQDAEARAWLHQQLNLA
ncbi:hypothetical protein C1O66_14575 [Paucibacter aquatile]|uniref:STAS/SEC14 domain-containing protein n=1 Tax=Kinneretia aquatilis TaxID=2070761 RepID=A0A2N8KYU9_9BURK|nr:MULTISPECIES: hypothetical protein [Roseateles]PND38629.1 hypothetical protein C1O66_14575 [Paucibacter aquatile]WIV97657.1 hypothetical protein K9V56_022020 [Paucibacter aquatile]